MKKLFLALLFVSQAIQSFAQIKWSKDLLGPVKNEWNNYSTSFIGDLDEKKPFLVTAIPYNGVYSNADDVNTAFDMAAEGSAFRFKSTLSATGRQLFTYDSGTVYFLTPGIYPKNAKEYEYRILLNNKTEIVPWSEITAFSDLTLNTLKKGFGFLGGYKSTWNNSISAELRRKRSDTSFALASVYWKQVKPAVQRIFTSKNLNEFFTLLKRPWDDRSQQEKLPAQLKLTAPENTLIFYLSGNIYKKEALEYQLEKDGNIVRKWGANDYDNNFIWLKDLLPGKYRVLIRYTRQRQNEAVYDFEISPQWQQTTLFKIIAGSLLAAFAGFIVLVFRTRKQKEKLRQAEYKQEKLVLGIRSVRSQLNPHFIFNSLASVQALVNRNETEEANKYLTAFGGILRQSLHYSERDAIPLAEEKKMLETYLQLEQLRFHFKYSITADENIPETELPVLLLQPLAENAVKHGVSGMQEKGFIKIHFSCNQKTLTVCIIDNGKGFDTKKATTGFGLKLTRERIDLINQVTEDQKIILNTESTEEGTKISLTFTNWL